MTITWTPELIVNIILVCAALAFWWAQSVVSGLFDFVRDALADDMVAAMTPPPSNSSGTPNPGGIASSVSASSSVPAPTDPKLLTSHMEKYSRISSAVIILQFVSIQTGALLSLVFALGFYKPFTALVQLTLPNRVVGLAVLASYCALVASYGVIADDVRDAVRRLFRRST